MSCYSAAFHPGQGILEGNRIIDNVGGNIWVRGSNPVLANNHIGGSTVGLQISHGSRGVYENNIIFRCTLSGNQVMYCFIYSFLCIQFGQSYPLMTSSKECSQLRYKRAMCIPTHRM